MNERLEGEAQAYLLGELDAPRRAAFERELVRDPVARAVLKACADAFAAAACEAAPAEPLPPADQAHALKAILAATQPEPAPARRADRWHSAWPLLWPAAAVLLLALNFLDFPRPLAPRSESKRTTVASGVAPSTQPGPDERPGTGEAATANPKDPAQPTPLARDAAKAARTEEELRQTREELADLRRAQAELRANYEAAIARFVDSSAPNKALNRFNTMELVDAATYARGERKGLDNIARAILTEPGVVVAHDPPPPVDGSSLAQPKPAYAWSVYDQLEQRGYLNLYQLPAPAPGQSMQIWVRPVEAKDFVRIGEVPVQFYGGNGTVQYTLPDGATPAEVLITVEPRGASPPAPSGPVVVRGP